MRIDVKKFLFVGAEDQKEDFFKKAQKNGLIDFINTNPSVIAKEMPLEIRNISSAIKILRHLPVEEQEENENLVQADIIVHQILQFHDENEKLLEELRVLNLEMARVSVFGDFSQADIEYIEREGQCKIQFFCAKPTLYADQLEPEGLIYISSEHNLNYYMAINPNLVSYPKMTEIKIEQPLGVLKTRYQEVEKHHKVVENRLKALAKYNDLLHRSLIEYLNKYHLNNAQTYVQEAMDGILFAVEGWVPVNKVNEVSHFIGNTPIHMEEIAIEPTDVVPTYLENQGFKRLGEDLVNIYDTPSSTDKDPSLWVLGSFALFFAFIIGDAGYGLIYLLIALFLRYKYRHIKTGLGRRVLNLFTILCVGCIIWGTLMTSFFGMQIAPDNPIRKISLLQWLVEKKAAYHINRQDEAYQAYIVKNPALTNVNYPGEFVSYVSPETGSSEILADLSNGILFELALFIGVVHLIFSLLRYVKRNWHAAGWIFFLTGAYLYFAAYLETPSLLNYVAGIDLEVGGSVGLQLMIGGIAFAWIGSIIRNGFTGIFEIMTVIQVFADVLSYLRLYALGLAGAIIGGTINEVAATLPFIAGILLIVLSHGVNIVLGTMSGVIHGLRLNFIEWYHYSFEGGGKQFRPLKLLKIE